MNIPTETLSAVAGAVVTIAGVLGAHKSGLPFRIVFGKPPMNGHTPVTKEMLKENCDLRQSALDRKLERIFAAVNATSEKVDSLGEKVNDHRIALGERLARCEEAIK